jgi:predicted MPP superfamily phosphohydrolase
MNRVKLSRRISSAIGSETPFRQIAGNWSQFARYALAEATTLSIEKIDIKLKRLPRKLNGFRLVHLSDIHHSPFTNLEHIERAVKIANRLNPQMFVLTGDYVSHETEYIEPVAEVLGRLESEFGTYACLGNHDHWTDAELVTKSFRDAKMNVLINEGSRRVVLALRSGRLYGRQNRSPKRAARQFSRRNEASAGA